MGGRASSLLPCKPISVAKVGPSLYLIQGNLLVPGKISKEIQRSANASFSRGSLFQRYRLFTGVSIPGTDIVGQDVNDGNCANDKITDERR